MGTEPGDEDEEEDVPEKASEFVVEDSPWKEDVSKRSLTDASKKNKRKTAASGASVAAGKKGSQEEKKSGAKGKSAGVELGEIEKRLEEKSSDQIDADLVTHLYTSVVQSSDRVRLGNRFPCWRSIF